MAAPAVVKILIQTDASQSSSSFKDAGDKASSFGSRFKAAFAGVLSANLAEGGTAIYDFGKQSISAYEASVNGQTEWSAAMSKVPGITASAKRGLEGQAEALAKTTTFSREATLAAQAHLASFGLTAAQIKKLTPLVQDYAARTGKDLPTAATDMGKALLGSGRSLKAIGINFKDTHDASKNYGELVDDLKGKVGGLADEMGSTGPGKMKIMQNQLAEFQVSLGLTRASYGSCGRTRAS